MSYTSEDIQLISIPLTKKDRNTAETFASEHSDESKREQVYRNTLAVLAVQRYFNMLGIPSELESSDSWNAAKRQSQDVADLFVPEIQDRVECRPIRPDDDRCYIPQQVWQNRAGYLVVELNDRGLEGIIRGYVPEVSVERLSLSYLQPLDVLFERIAAGPITQISRIASAVTTLSTWRGIASLGWSKLRDMPPSAGLKWLAASDRSANEAVQKAVLNLYQSDSNLAALPSQQLERSPIDALSNLVHETQDDWIRWQAAELLQSIAPEHSAAAIIGAKDIGLYLAGQTIALLVGTIAKPNGKTLVMARVYPMGDLVVLPSGLKLTGFTSEGDTFFEVISRKRDDYIQFLFTADLGDEFSIKVSLDTASVTESFLI